MTENKTDRERRREGPRKIPSLHGYVFAEGEFRHRFEDDFPAHAMDVRWEIESINAENPTDKARLRLTIWSVPPAGRISIMRAGGSRTEEEQRRSKIAERLHFGMTLIVCWVVTGQEACEMAGSGARAKEIVMKVLKGDPGDERFQGVRRYQWMLGQVREDAARVEREMEDHGELESEGERR